MAATTDIQADEQPAQVVNADDVANSRSAACWAVRDEGWKDLAPALPDDMIALLAPPVVVTAEAV